MHRAESPGLLTDLLSGAGRPDGSAGSLRFTVDGEQLTDSLSRSELTRRAGGVAHLLRQQTRPGLRALVSFPTGADFFSAFFGCLYAGILPVPVPSIRNARSLAQLEPIASECGAALLMIPPAAADRVQSVDRDFWRRTQLQPMVVDGSESHEIPEDAPHPAGPNEVAYLQFTSGSTGSPRGVMVSHANVLNNVRVIDEKAGKPRQGAAVSWLPLYHDMGLVSVMYSLYAGLDMVLLSPAHFVQQPLRWMKAVSRFRAVYSGGPNFAYELAHRIEAPLEEADLKLDSWQFAFCGAEMVRPATLRSFVERFRPFGFRPEALCPAYGLAESTLVVSSVPAGVEPEVRKLKAASLIGGPALPADPDARGPSTEISECGAAGSGHRIRVVDPEAGRALEDGQVGEIWVSGPSKALGYWGRPEDSRATFEARLEGDEATYLRTGDLGFLDGGRLFVTGRIKELVVVRGRKFHPREIEEAAASSHPAVSAVGAAFGVTREDSEALVVLSELHRRSRRYPRMNEILMAIQDALVRRLDVKADFIGLTLPGSIPRTTSGKVQRLKCREQFGAGLLSLVASWPESEPEPAEMESVARREREKVPGQLAFEQAGPSRDRLAIQNWIVGWMSSRLGLPAADIDPRRPLSAYGLDSLGAVALTRELQDRLRTLLPETLVWSYPTPEDLGAYLERALREAGTETPNRRSNRLRSQVELALQWVEQLTETEVDHYYHQRIAKYLP